MDCEDEKWLERGIQRSFGGFHDQRCRVPIFRPSPSPDVLAAAITSACSTDIAVEVVIVSVVINLYSAVQHL